MPRNIPSLLNQPAEWPLALFFFVRWGMVFLLPFLIACPTRPIRPSLPRFSLKNSSSCLQFRDRQGLRFCVPKRTKLLFPKRKNIPEPFEVLLTIPHHEIVLLVRKDPLPDELPEGALSAPWLLRYAEGYARRRNPSLQTFKSRILERRFTSFFHAHHAVWIAFSLTSSSYHWEETLILAKDPSTRYVLSLRVSRKERYEKTQFLYQFFKTFLANLSLF